MESIVDYGVTTTWDIDTKGAVSEVKSVFQEARKTADTLFGQQRKNAKTLFTENKKMSLIASQKQKQLQQQSTMNAVVGARTVQKEMTKAFSGESILSSMKKGATTLGKTVGGSVLGGLGLGMGFGVASMLGSLVSGAMNTGQTTADTSLLTGMSYDKVASFANANIANGMGTGAQRQQGAIDTLSNMQMGIFNAQRGTGGLLPLLARFGIASRDKMGNDRDPNAVLADLAEAMKGKTAPEKRIMMQMAGISPTMLPWMEKGRKGYWDAYKKSQVHTNTSKDDVMKAEREEGTVYATKFEAELLTVKGLMLGGSAADGFFSNSSKAQKQEKQSHLNALGEPVSTAKGLSFSEIFGLKEWKEAFLHPFGGDTNTSNTTTHTHHTTININGVSDPHKVAQHVKSVTNGTPSNMQSRQATKNTGVR